MKTNPLTRETPRREPRWGVYGLEKILLLVWSKLQLDKEKQTEGFCGRGSFCNSSEFEFKDEGEGLNRVNGI